VWAAGETSVGYFIMIGLKQNTVQIVDHQVEWAALGVAICMELQNGNDFFIDVQHVGSTAVPGLPAKPIIDIAAAVENFDTIPEIIQTLTEQGYVYRGVLKDILLSASAAEKTDSHLFHKESSPGIRMTHLHIAKHNGPQWKNAIVFRELLRNDPEIRDQYVDLKKKLRNRFKNDRKSYTASKHDFIQLALKTKGTQLVHSPELPRR